MAQAELDRLEGEVHEARQRLKSDLEVLRAPGTFATFKDELVTEARASGDDAVANAKSTATDWSERLVAEIKQRAAANPVAVGAIAAGIGWRILRKPPITTMLVGYGLYSLYRTKPGELAPGAERVYQAADFAVAAKDQATDFAVAAKEQATDFATAARDQVQQWSRDVGEVAARVREVVAPAVADAVQQLSAEGGDAVAKATDTVKALVASGSESVRHWSSDIGTTISRLGDTAQDLGTRGSRSLQQVAMDREERDKILLGAAAVALTTALSLAWLRRP